MTTVRGTGRLDGVGRRPFAAPGGGARDAAGGRSLAATDAVSVQSSYRAYGPGRPPRNGGPVRDGAPEAPADAEPGPIAGGRPKPPPVLGCKDCERETALA